MRNLGSFEAIAVNFSEIFRFDILKRGSAACGGGSGV